MLLVTEVLAEYLMRVGGLVLRRWSRWSLLTWVWVPLVLRLMIQVRFRVRARCPMGDYLRRIRGRRVSRLQGMVF
jgi:1,4-dihydroxy-2-naphthoate octaprenyltransferase